MKIGIITFHFGDNYGAVLQTAATFQYLVRQGHEPVVLNYLPFSGRQEPLLKNWRKEGDLKAGVIRKFGRFFTCRKSSSRFEEFREAAFSRTEECRSLAALTSITRDLDAVVTGSDQVWHFGRSSAYFLAWESGGNLRRIAYAPCCATDDQDYSKAEELKGYLARFHAISVRDSASRRAIGRVMGKEPLIVCDPTLLVPLEHLQSNAGENSDYILTYILGAPSPGVLRDSIAELRKKTGIRHVKAIVGPALQNWRSPKEADEVLWGPRPADWLGLIKNCKALLTDSFHGCLFAMRYDVPFVGFYKEALRAPRLVDLNERYFLGDQICDEADLVEVCRGGLSTLSGESRMKVMKHIEQSEDYLNGALAPNRK